MGGTDDEAIVWVFAGFAVIAACMLLLQSAACVCKCVNEATTCCV